MNYPIYRVVGLAVLWSSKFITILFLISSRDRYTRESRGFAFVRFYDKHDAEDAMDRMDGKELDGRELRVQMARQEFKK